MYWLHCKIRDEFTFNQHFSTKIQWYKFTLTLLWYRFSMKGNGGDIEFKPRMIHILLRFSTTLAPLLDASYFKNVRRVVGTASNVQEKRWSEDPSVICLPQRLSRWKLLRWISIFNLAACQRNRIDDFWEINKNSMSNKQNKDDMFKRTRTTKLFRCADHEATTVGGSCSYSSVLEWRYMILQTLWMWMSHGSKMPVVARAKKSVVVVHCLSV